MCTTLSSSKINKYVFIFKKGKEEGETNSQHIVECSYQAPCCFSAKTSSSQYFNRYHLVDGALTHFSFFHAWSSQQHFLQGHRSLPRSLGEVSCPHPQGNCLVFHLRTDMEHCPSIFIPDIYSVFWKVLLVVRVKALWKWERKECFELRKVEY